MPDTSVTLGGSAYLLLLLPVLLGLAIHGYRRPDRRMTAPIRALLILRMAALLIAAALLVEPLFAFSFRRSKPPTIAILVDESASMTIDDAGAERRKVLLDLLGSPKVREALARAGDPRVFAFAESLRVIDFSGLRVEGSGRPSPPAATGHTPPPRWDGPATDLGGALRALPGRFEKSGLSAVLLFSDGAANLGPDPEAASVALGVPVTTVGFGDPREPKDIALVSATCDPIGTVGREIPVRIRIRSAGYAGVRAAIEIRLSGRAVLSRPIAFEDGEQQVEVPLTPDTPGRQIYEVRVPPQAEERTGANNSAYLPIDVLKARTRILLASGSPNPDFAYLRRLLAADPNRAVDIAVASEGVGLSGREDDLFRKLREFDLVVLIDLPRAALAGSDRALADFVRAGGGLLVVGGRNALDGGYASSALSEILPVRPIGAGPSFQEDRFQVEFAEPDHPILSLSEDPEADARDRSELPPLLGYNRTLGARPGAVVLAYHPGLRTADGARMPLISLITAGSGRVMAVSCATVYRLSALMWGIGKSGETSDRLWRNVFQWLLTPENARRVRVHPERPVWRNGEAVTFRAALFDALMRPRRGGLVTVTVSDTAGPRTVALTESGQGGYTGQVRGLSPGEHRFEGKALVDGAEAGADSGAFTVSASSLEFDLFRMNEDLLRRIARATGGDFLRPEQFPAFADTVKFPAKDATEVRKIRLWGEPWALVAFVGLLSAEWVIRRRRGMM